jgi:DNA/RNA endonuclease YhcR with UshA esterase domain
MKIGKILLVAIMLAAFASLALGQAPDAGATVPKYDLTTEVTLKGTITDISERTCPVSGGMGFHFILKPQDGKTIEIHVATSKFVKANEMGVTKGDVVEVVGSKVKFEGVETILARQVTRGDDTFVFRFKDGRPAW